MRFLLMTLPQPGVEQLPPTPEDHARAGALIEEMAKTGKIVDTGSIQVPSTGTKVRYADGKFTVTDGPYAESKEMIAGYAIVDVDSKEEALALSRRFYEVMGDGEGECLAMDSVPFDRP